MSATMMGRTTSPPLPAAVPSPDGVGEGTTVATAVAGSAVSDAAALAAAEGARVAVTATVKLHTPRATSPSSADTDVHSTRYCPDASGAVGVATIRLSFAGSTLPLATWDPVGSLMTSVLSSGFIASL